MTTIGKYELHEQLGKGGFGTVYRATDTALCRDVALKVLHPQLMVDETFISRFKKEARLLASLDHPNIITIFDMGEIDGRVYLAMRFLTGGNLEQLLQKEGSLPWSRVKEIMEQVCDGLGSAHQKNLVHRDIKPANILFDSRGNAVISDFGLARAVQLSGNSSSASSVGTPAYRAPELWRGKPPATPATDVYSLGCILTEMLSGESLFVGETPDEILTQHLIDGPQLPRTWPAGVPTELSHFINTAFSKDPSQRQQSANSFYLELSGLDHPAPIKIKSLQLEKKPAVTRKNEMSILIAPGVSMEFVRVPEGEFLMGSDPAKDGTAKSDEMPLHTVYLDEYWIGKYPVTNQQYLAYLTQIGVKYNKLIPGKAIHPATNINWYEAAKYCVWVSTEYDVHLPTEAQWEKAGRGIDQRIYPWGNELPAFNRSNYAYQVGDTTAVGSFPDGKSPYGALDISGNVFEWVADWYGNSYYKVSPVQNPQGIENEYRKVLRGGSWTESAEEIRVARRFKGNPDIRNTSIGFRCVLEKKKEATNLMGLMSQWV